MFIRNVSRSFSALCTVLLAASMIGAKAARYHNRTVYEIQIAWELLEGFSPQPRHSLGISLLINDVDQGERRNAEYGSGVAHAKRPSEFAALRLAGRPER